MLNAYNWILNVECWMHIAGCWMHIVEYWMRKVECWMHIVECWMHIVECWMQRVEYCYKWRAILVAPSSLSLVIFTTSIESGVSTPSSIFCAAGLPHHISEHSSDIQLQCVHQRFSCDCQVLFWRQSSSSLFLTKFFPCWNVLVIWEILLNFLHADRAQ